MIGIYENLYNSFVHNKQDTPGYMLINRIITPTEKKNETKTY
jgi:hypothetical protein